MKRFLTALYGERKLLLLTTFFFVGSVLMGFFASAPIWAALEQSSIWEKFNEVSQSIKADPSFVHVFLLLFMNNTQAVVSIMGLGIFWGIYPLFALITNGLMLGAVLGHSAHSGMSPILTFITKILPHGIFELPAIIIGSAFGIRLGILFFQWMVSWMIPIRKEKTYADWRVFISSTPAIVLGIIILLVCAATIEACLILLHVPQSIE